MRTFLALVARRGRLSPETLVAVPKLAAVALPFRDLPYRSDGWVSPTVTLALYAWDNDVAGTAGFDLIHRDEAVGAWTHSGYVGHPKIGDNRDAGEIAKAVSGTYPDLPRLGGTFAIVRADSQREAVEVWNAVTRLEPVYWGETEEAFVVTNRALLLSFVLAGKPEPAYEPANLFSFMSRGYFANDLTPFRGVNVMPPETRLAIDTTGIRLSPSGDTIAAPTELRANERRYDELADHLCRDVAAFRGREVLCSLTGGKDSRLVAAALHKAGVEFRTRTKGFPGHPDVVVGARLAAALGVPHACEPPPTEERHGRTVIEVDLRQRANQALFAMDGMTSAFYAADEPPPAPFSQRVELGGGGGETLRGGFARSLDVTRPIRRSDVDRYLERTFFYTKDVFQPEAVAGQRDYFARWFDEETARFGPTTAFTRYHLIYRTGRWASGAYSAIVNRLDYHPLFDNVLTSVGVRLSNGAKRREEVVYNLLLRLAPPLVEEPFAKQRWKFEEHGPLPGDDAGWQRRAPLKLHRHVGDAFDWRFACGTDLRQDLVEQILHDERAEAVFGVVRREAVRNLLAEEGRAGLATQVVLMLWGVYSASVLLSNSWIARTDEGRTTEVVVPPS